MGLVCLRNVRKPVQKAVRTDRRLGKMSGTLWAVVKNIFRN